MPRPRRSSPGRHHLPERSGENAARAAIEADGYKGVQELRLGDNGVWHAKAFRGRTEVRLTVDARGAVTTAD
jgi:hypothetical protein